MVQVVDVHLCLVSANITPNLAPLLNDTTCPRHVALLYATVDLAWLESLTRVIKTLDNVTVSCHLLSNAECAESVRADVLAVLARHEGQVIGLNASGGSRLVSLIASQVFQSLNQPVFYVDAQTDQLVSVQPHDTPVYSLNRRVDVQQYLMASGYHTREVSGISLTVAQRAFAQELLANIRHYSNALAILNWLAASAGNGLQSRSVEGWHMSSPGFIGLLDRLRDAGLALVNRNCLVFKNESAKFFVNGGWLQDYVALVLNELKQGSAEIQDIQQNLVVNKSDEPPVALDSAFLVNNRLHLIECRAKKFKKGTAKNGAEAIHRPDEVMELANNLRARSLLLSYSPLREVDLRRMQLMDIKVLQEKQLHNLRRHLEEWIGG